MPPRPDVNSSESASVEHRNAPATLPPLPAFPRAFAALPRLAQINLVLCAVLVGGLTALLFPHWQDNPDLSHGYLMPLIFLLLLHEARSGTQRFLAPSLIVRLAPIFLVALSIVGFAASGLYAAAVDWSHSLVASTLTFSAVLLLGAAFVIFAGQSLRLIPFNWSACTALLLWLLSAPIPPGTYSRLTFSLQLFVTENVLRALHLLGIAANRHGNIIDLATTSVGVEDACSGVRSLISCVFAGFFFSAMLVRRPWARALLIGLAAPLAIAMNFLRSLLLTLLANSGVDIAGTWHDVTGFAVLGVTAICLGTLALLLERKSAPPSPGPAASVASIFAAAPSTRIAPLLPLTAGLVLFFALGAFFFANTRPSVRQNLPIPDLAAILPAELAGWRVETSQEVYQFTSTLRTEHLAQRTYLRPTAEGFDQVTIYLAYWRPGQASVSLVASHTPDACWPGSGWNPIPRPQAREQLSLPGRTLAMAESRLFRNGDFPQHVWFWHLYDGRPIPYRDPYSARELLSIAWQYGFTRDGDQLFVRISSNRPWPALAGEPLLSEVFSRLESLGL